MSPMIPVVCGVVEHGGRVLVALRGPGMRHAGWWEFPGGKLEPGETPAQALIRELDEELGIRVEPGEELCRMVVPPIELITLYATLIAGEPEAREHAEVRWVSIDELNRFPFAEADLRTVALLRERAHSADIASE